MESRLSLQPFVLFSPPSDCSLPSPAVVGPGPQPNPDAEYGELAHATLRVAVRGFEYHRKFLDRTRHQHAVLIEETKEGCIEGK